MVLLSPNYLLFVTVVFILYFLVPQKYKVFILLVGSISFIALFSINVAVFSLIFTTLNYWWGIILERNRNKPVLKNRIFWLVILLDIAILAFFKYFTTFSKPINIFFFDSAQFSGDVYKNLMIPLGISYYTFQSLGYLIRIDRGSENAERNYFAFALYLIFFPKFLAGPVERSNRFLPQLKNVSSFSFVNLGDGLRLFLWGLFKKVVIADTLYRSVSAVYDNVYTYSGVQLFVILIVGTVYIYCDFSGYTDMALGSAKIFGLNLMDNFNRPFMARNISEFWRRWHISLSSWCNDFIYNPFIVKFRQHGNFTIITGIFLTFFIVGIWHGPNWTFVILGMLQGAAIVYEFFTKRKRLKIATRFRQNTVNALSRILVFFFMSFSMVFFFSKTVSDAIYFIGHIFRNIRFDAGQFKFIGNPSQFLFALFCFLLILIIQVLNEKGKKILSVYLRQPLYLQWIGYFVCAILIYLNYSGIRFFYYMRF